MLLDVGLGAGAGVGLHHVAEVVGREVHFVGKLAYRGQAALAGFAAVEVAAQEGVELCDEFLAGGLAAGKLAGVVAAAVAKEQREVGAEEFAAKSVYGVLQFFGQAVERGVEVLSLAL